MVVVANDVSGKGNILVMAGLTGMVVGIDLAVVVVAGGSGRVVVCGVVLEGSPSVSGCKGLNRACISGSAKICRLCSVFLCPSQLSTRRPLCCVLRGFSGLMGVRSLLNDLMGTDNRCGDVSVLRDKVLPTVRPLSLGEEFRDDERFSNTEGG